MTYNGGTDWWALGTGFPLVSVWQLDLDPAHRVLAAGTHGRGAFDIIEPSVTAPALVLSKVDAGKPVGPGSNVDYTITLKNIGNADATGVDDHRSGARQHELRLGRGRRDVLREDRHVVRPFCSGRKQRRRSTSRSASRAP